ncbi:unnamed protein product [Nippostrongylus brasiliensis]|uniref:carbonic anhydrase n=1 Tax=Nippostrongylus brasiliensis TaxID=27835 RepID=A0A0N4YN72_NIPBR|nr:unnamed protein product [Nippostrongylus brasiliensis]
MLRATATNSKKVPLKTLRPSVFLPEDRATFFSYAGSLTTPPCTEGVLWIVMAQPKIISAAQHKQISRGDVTTHKHLENAAMIGIARTKLSKFFNARPIQPLYGRHVFVNRVTSGIGRFRQCRAHGRRTLIVHHREHDAAAERHDAASAARLQYLQTTSDILMERTSVLLSRSTPKSNCIFCTVEENRDSHFPADAQDDQNGC